MALDENISQNEENDALLNKPLSFVVVMVGIAFAVLNLQLVFGDEQNSRWLIVVYSLLAFIAIFVVMFWVFDSKNTVVNDQYVAKGKTKIYWHEVTNFKANDFSVVIQAGDKKAVINYYAYSNPEGLMARINHLLNKRG
ncbi:hypothetical protein A1OO_13080 [Enterovibrio norvegicus FF-33]|uniref:hypothetical protein n=1 Tax=Enterovibrio norvegicus TaxID=188144 RepID=UPI0002EBFC88|nr:hypothetical protein [Enterovibrio norvegicus]OEE66697.1 hypothetical protein A1OO_13080 [Enterovibrio norvegicus FF-33]OEE86432.1 hypothetical protein A1OQ_16915 [Enterovibrio norvegicus FF-162]